MNTARHTPILAAAGILIAMFAFGAFRYPHFAGVSTVTGLLSDYSFVGVAAVGATLVILSGGIDLSAGAVIACTSILIAQLIGNGWHPMAAVAAALAAGAAAGLLMGVLIHAFALPAFMVTLAGMFAIRACGFMIHSQSLSIDHPFYSRVRELGIPLTSDAIMSPGAIVLLVVLGIGWMVAARTSFGRCIYALGGNERSSRVMGLPIARTRIAAYAIAGFCSALGGCLLTLFQGSGDPASAVGLELDIIASVVIGGTMLSGGIGSIPGTLIGLLILGLIRTIIDFEGNLNAAWTSIATGMLLLVFLAVQRVGASGVSVARRIFARSATSISAKADLP